MKVVVAFGTRPEAIKLAPVIAELRRRPSFDVKVVLTAQHRELLDQVLSVFAIVPDRDLALMQPSQTLSALTSRVVPAMDAVFEAERPDATIVQGDTTSAFATALSSFYRGVPVVHVEAGLRTSTVLNPFPEELNRRLTSVLTWLHCAPTPRAQQALIDSGVAAASIVMTGNPIVDALHEIRRSAAMKAAQLPSALDPRRPIVLVTLHRRENWPHLPEICDAIRTIVSRRPDVQVVLPVHPNPVVQNTIGFELGKTSGVVLIPALDYLTFIKVLAESAFVLTDSGGIQEEAPVLGRPVLVLREETERPEAVEAGVARVIGVERDAIVAHAMELLDDPAARQEMSQSISPFGDGRAASRIADALEARRAELAEFAMRRGNPRASDVTSQPLK